MGGGETLTYQLAHKLAEKGHQITLITNKHPLRDCSKFKFKIIEIEGFDEDNINLNKAIPSLYNVIKNLDTDILHVYNYVPFFLLNQLLEDDLKFKIVWTVYNTPLVGKRVFGVLKDYKSELFLARKLLNSKAYSFLINVSRYYDSSSKVIAGSTIPSVLIRCGVDLEIFKPSLRSNFRSKYSISKKDKLILCTSRFTPRKGVEHLIKAMTYLDKDYKLFLTGSAKPTDQDVFDRIINLINDLGLKDRVILPKEVFDYEDMPKLYKASDVFVIPSQFEGFGIVSIEAMACGIPVIGTNVPGVNEVITNGYNGLLVPFGNSKAIVTAIRRIVEDKKLSNKLSVQALDFVRREHNLEEFVYEHLQSYQKLFRKQYFGRFNFLRS